MATCKTCGAEIEVPEGWSVGPAVRRHYWEAHSDLMQRTKARQPVEPVGPIVTTHRIAVEYEVEAPSREQAEQWVQVAAVAPFKHSRRGTGRIVRETEKASKP